MKKLEELGISPAPWKVIEYGNRTGSTISTEGALVFDDDGEEKDLFEDDLTKISNARLIAAAPELYKWLAFAVEQYKCETRNCDNCPNGKCWVVDATAALAKAAGESEVAK